MKIFWSILVFLAVVLRISDATSEVLMIVAKNGFRDEEVFITKEILENNGYMIDVASSSRGICLGMLGKSINAEISIEEINVSDYSVVVFIGGIGAREFFDSTLAHGIVKKAYQENKIIAAICIAPVILAQAGILEDKHATVLNSFKAQIQQYGAVYTGNGVEVDGNIITADGPGATEGFAYRILDVLKKK
ncbi:MAG: DJ-1/PfpI family protein [Candidatus Saelkia tenebricola]|nr:DJ-1/PfpI family protein [Candidatus Saelkia tenebricola]